MPGPTARDRDAGHGSRRGAADGREWIACHACGEGRSRPFIRDPGYPVVRCAGCGLYYVNPVPRPAELARRVRDSRAYTEDQLRKRDFFRRRAERLLERVEAVRRPGRLLDVGCAVGTELEVARARGWDAVGLELAESSVARARAAGLDVRARSLLEADLGTGSFDLVTMNHVLEHVAHTPAFMAETRRVLRPGGLLYVSLPNVHAWPFFLRRARYRWTFHEDHFIHFSTATLRRFLARHRFDVVEMRTSRWRDFHEPPESRPPASRALNAAVERAGLGIEILCLARALPPAG